MKTNVDLSDCPCWGRDRGELYRCLEGATHLWGSSCDAIKQTVAVLLRPLALKPTYRNHRPIRNYLPLLYLQKEWVSYLRFCYVDFLETLNPRDPQTTSMFLRLTYPVMLDFFGARLLGETLLVPHLRTHWTFLGTTIQYHTLDLVVWTHLEHEANMASHIAQLSTSGTSNLMEAFWGRNKVWNCNIFHLWSCKSTVHEFSPMRPCAISWDDTEVANIQSHIAVTTSGSNVHHNIPMRWHSLPQKYLAGIQSQSAQRCTGLSDIIAVEGRWQKRRQARMRACTSREK